MNWSLVLPIIGVLAVPIGAYLATRRSSSGRIETSQPAELWAEGRAIRDDLRAELTVVRLEVATLKGELIACKERVAFLEKEIMHK